MYANVETIGGPSMHNAVTHVTAAERDLERRFNRKRIDPENFTYEFTRDLALLHQYFGLYERECRIVRTPEFIAAEEEYNRRSHILIVRHGNLVIGGGRLTVRTPRITKPLPIEIGEFRLEDHYPELKQKEMSYGEFSRLYVLPEFRNSDVTLKMWQHLYRKCVALNLDITFAAAPYANLRVYKKLCALIGVEEISIRKDIELPAYPGFEEVKDHLASGYIKKEPMEVAHQEATESALS